MRPKMSTLKSRPTIWAMILYCLWVIIFASFSYKQEKEKLYQSVDAKLRDAAHVVSLILPQNFHHKGILKSDFSDENYFQLTEKLSKYTDKNNITP